MLVCLNLYCPVPSDVILSYHCPSSPILSHSILPSPMLFYPMLLYSMPFYPIRTILFNLRAHLTPSYPTLAYYILSCFILSYPVLYCVISSYVSHINLAVIVIDLHYRPCCCVGSGLLPEFLLSFAIHISLTSAACPAIILGLC